MILQCILSIAFLSIFDHCWKMLSISNNRLEATLKKMGKLFLTFYDYMDGYQKSKTLEDIMKFTKTVIFKNDSLTLMSLICCLLPFYTHSNLWQVTLWRFKAMDRSYQRIIDKINLLHNKKQTVVLITLRITLMIDSLSHKMVGTR